MNRGHIEHCIDVSPQPHSASVTQIETLGRGVYAVLVGGVILSAILAGMALVRADGIQAELGGRVALAEERASKAEREARVMQERWNDLKVELVRRGIPVSDH